MSGAFQSGRPDAARHEVVKKGDLHCVRLLLPPKVSDDPDEPDDADEDLLRRYSPEFVILPEVNGSDPRPYPDGTNDYQPHAVEVYLADIGTVKQVPRGILGLLNVVATGLGYAAFALAFVLALGGAEALFVIGFAVAGLLIAAIAGLFAYWYRYVGTPASEGELRELAKQPDRAFEYATTVFPAAGAGSPEQAWEQYRQLIEAKKPPRVVYGRVRREGGMKVLQYWLFYYYNDWWNQHEADWEVAMVFLDTSDRPLTVACSSHLAGTWRSWDATEPAGPEKQHPRVYVARGSHALYFSAANGVHDAVLQQPWAVFDLQGRLTVRGQQDSVGQPVLGDEPYELKFIPDGVDRLPSGDPEWTNWWWLQFMGRWGAKDGIRSPAVQDGGLRWNSPTIWAKCFCDADSSSWRDVVDVVAG